MKMKLKLTANFQQIKDDQNVMAFLKLLHFIYLQLDREKQNIMEFVKTEKTIPNISSEGRIPWILPE